MKALATVLVVLVLAGCVSVTIVGAECKTSETLNLGDYIRWGVIVECKSHFTKQDSALRNGAIESD